MRSFTRKSNVPWFGVASFVLGLATTCSLRAQAPLIPGNLERSGLQTRFQPIMRTNLPHDKDRDNFYGTRYGDYSTSGRTNNNNFLNGGLYGLPLDIHCSRAMTPYFNGVPGTRGPLCPDCLPWYKNQTGRLVQNLFHQFRPVGHYYQNGSYVPIYDLDPLIPGPGVDLWPYYHNGYRGG